MSLLLLFNGGSAAAALCLWNMIDDYLQAQLTAHLGTAGTYSTLQLAQVDVGEITDIDRVTMPYCLISGLEMNYNDNDGPHGDGDIHYDDIEYPYDIYLITSHTTAAGAKGDAQELLRRLREWVRSDPYLGGLQDDNGEIVLRMDIGQPQIRVEGKGGQNRGLYLGKVLMPLTVASKV